MPLGPIEGFLNPITNPTLAAILLTIGLNAILFELSSPGGYAAGLIGVICLLLAFYALGTLNANWAGLGFVVMAFVLFVLDIKAPTHGVLTFGGIAAFVFGAFLFSTHRISMCLGRRSSAWRWRRPRSLPLLLLRRWLPNVAGPPPAWKA